MDDFVDWLMEQMEERGMTQSQLARASGLSRQAISDYINRKRIRPNEETLQSLARGLHLPIETVYRAAGILPPETETNEQIEEALHILKMLDGDDLEEIIQIARLKLERKPKIKKSRRDPARSVLIDK